MIEATNLVHILLYRSLCLIRLARWRRDRFVDALSGGLDAAPDGTIPVGAAYPVAIAHSL